MGVQRREIQEIRCDGIEYFGINTKAGDDAAIGKFGLGMKSVFHLCEAFHVAYDGSEIHKRILNPWYSDVDEEAFHNGMGGRVQF